jgi:hypothetical protein
MTEKELEALIKNGTLSNAFKQVVKDDPELIAKLVKEDNNRTGESNGIQRNDN